MPARGSARRARTDALLRATVADHLRQHGYAGLTIERVASESGVAKTTIYRRWASKAEMVFALAIHADAEPPAIATGSLAGDVRQLADRAVSLVATEPGRSVLPGLLADMIGDPHLSDRLRGALVGAARGDIDGIIEQARVRGDLRGNAPVDEFHATLLGVPYARVHLLGEEDPDRIATELSAQLLALLGA